MNYNYFQFKAIIERRKSENREYNDYLQILLNAINNTIDCDVEENQSNKTMISDQLFGQFNADFKSERHAVVTEDDLLANCLQFILAGYETMSSFLSFFFYSLALNEKCQQKLYEEIKQLNGDFNYENITQMPYMEACVAETLRLYNPLPTNMRRASQDYSLGQLHLKISYITILKYCFYQGETGITIPKGTIVGIDVQTVHHSHEYYPNPEIWDPQRFMPENRDKLVPDTYMPFGIGPRNCVGMRFALMEAKTAIAYLVNRFEFIRTSYTKPLTKPKKFTFNLFYGDLNVGLKLRNNE